MYLYNDCPDLVHLEQLADLRVARGAAAEGHVLSVLLLSLLLVVVVVVLLSLVVVVVVSSLV